MRKLGIGAVAMALILFAAGRAGGGRPSPPGRRRRRRPDAEGDGVPVGSPRNPTLSGGAAATIDA